MATCPGCKSTAVRTLIVGKRQRIECAGCSRFAGYVTNEMPPPQPDPVEQASRVSAERRQTEAATWLYVSKRLDLQLLPNVPMWNAEAISLGGVIYYRLTADVLAWLEAAGESLITEVTAGRVDGDQLDAYLEAMGTVYAVGSPCISAPDLVTARAHPPSLPQFYLLMAFK